MASQDIGEGVMRQADAMSGGTAVHAHGAVTAAPPPPASAWWLAAAAVFLPFANGRNNAAVAAWVAPVFVLRFLRGGRARRLIAAYLVLAAASAFQFRGMVPAPLPLYALISLFFGAFDLLPFLADRLLVGRVRGFAATLVFPCAAAGFDYLLSLLPYGSWGSRAYTQYGNLPLMQLASVTGIYGITFVIAWFASVVNWAWERDFEWRRVRRGVLVYAAVLTAVLFFGSIRLMFPPPGPAVRVASLTRPDIDPFPSADVERRSVTGALTADEIQVVRSISRTIDEDLLRRAAREADAGAKIVFWAEGNSHVLPQDEPWLMERASALARDKKIYLGLGNVVWHMGTATPLENTFVLFGPDGNRMWRFRKAHPVPGGEATISMRGDGRLPFADTPLGRLSGAICFDADSVQLLHQAGEGRAGLLLLPSNDWRAIDPWHSQMAVFRAVEEGTNLIRHTSRGLSIAVDYQGRVRAAMDHYDIASERVMVSEVPTRSAATVYARVGDAFSWLVLAGLAALAVTAVRRPRRGSPQRT